MALGATLCLLGSGVGIATLPLLSANPGGGAGIGLSGAYERP